MVNTLADSMLSETRIIESALVQKLNCMYFVACKVSLPSIDAMLKKEKSQGTDMYLDYSKQLNQLINKYFSIETQEDMEIQIAGDREMRDAMIPLLFIDSSREKASLESQIKQVLKLFHYGQNPN